MFRHRFRMLSFSLYFILPQIGQSQCCIGTTLATDVIFNNTHVTNAMVLSDRRIFITGTVDFDADMTLQGCRLIICQDGILNIAAAFSMTESSQTLVSVITGCTQKWSTINVNDGGSITLDNCLVRDGASGIVLHQGFDNTISRIERTVFTGNEVSISAIDCDNFSLNAFVNNTFQRQRLNDAGQTVNPLPPNNSVNSLYRGMYFLNATGSLGNLGIQNIITNLNQGVLLLNSDLTIQNCDFTQNQILFGQPRNTGVGILSTNSTLNMADIFSNAASCRFINNETGIISLNTVQLKVTDAIFTSSNVNDIFVNNSQNPNLIDIRNNTMNLDIFRQNSIFVQRAPIYAGNSINIRNNHFICDPTVVISNNVRLINIEGALGSQFSNDLVVIQSNTLDCNYQALGNGAITFDGIFANGLGYGLRISNNHLNYNLANAASPANGLASIGIGVQWPNAWPSIMTTPVNKKEVNLIGPDNNLQASHVQNPSGVCNTGAIGVIRCSWLKCGIHAVSAPKTFVCSNIVNDAFQDFHFSGNLTGSEFGRNSIGDGNLGVNFCTGGASGGCGAVTTFPDQDFRLNRWDNPHSYSATAASFLVPTQPWNDLNNWQVHPMLLNQNPNDKTTAPQPNNWYTTSDDSESQTLCDGFNPQLLSPNPTGETAKKLVNGVINYPEPAQKWEFERYLLGEMILNPTTFGNEPVAVSYFNSKQSLAIFKVAKVETLIAQGIDIGQSQQVNIANLLVGIKQAGDSLSKLAATNGLSQNLNFAQLQSAKRNLLSQIRQKSAQIAQNSQSLSLLKADYWQNTVRPAANSIQPSNAIETNYKFIYQLKIKELLGEPVTATDSAIIRQIAYQCPATEGDVVNVARQMLPMAENRSFDREGLDYYCVSRPRNTPEIVATNFGKISPNPANDQLHIQFDKSFSGKMRVTNTFGKVVWESQEKDAFEKDIQTIDFPSGLYWISFVGDNGINRSSKFIIIH